MVIVPSYKFAFRYEQKRRVPHSLSGTSLGSQGKRGVHGAAAGNRNSQRFTHTQPREQHLQNQRVYWVPRLPTHLDILI